MDRTWIRLAGRIIRVLAELALIFIGAVVVWALLSGSPGHDEIVTQLDRIECVVVLGPERTPADIAACQLGTQ